MEEQLNTLAATHLLQHTLRSLCIHEDSQWVYAVFWRILPRNYPPPKWDLHGGAFDRSRGNRRNWILVWEDGFCNFAATTANCASSHHGEGLQPEIFFKMSHEIYNYGEGLIGKVAADRSHKWVFKEPQEHDICFLPAWHNIPIDSHPRTWEAQFQSGIMTIALIAVREGVLQLGAVNKVMEDPACVVLLRKRFSYLESIPGVLLPPPPFKIDGHNAPERWVAFNSAVPPPPPPPAELHHLSQQQGRITPSTSNLQALLPEFSSVDSSSLLPPLADYLQTPMLLPLHLRPVEREGLDGEPADGEYHWSEGGREIAGGHGFYYAHTVTGPDEPHGTSYYDTHT